MTSCEVHGADRCYVGHQDRRRDEDRHQGRLRQDRQHQGRRGVRHQDHQGRQDEEQNQYVGHQDHQGRRDEGHQVHLYEGHQGLDDCQDRDGNQHHQGRGVRHQDQGGNQDEIHQELPDHLEEVEWVDQMQTLGLEEAELVEHLGRQERQGHEEACRLVVCPEELTESTAQVALMASD